MTYRDCDRDQDKIVQRWCSVNPLISLFPVERFRLPALMISGRKPKMTHNEGFMYDTELVTTDGKFHNSQINISLFKDKNFSVFLPNTEIDQNKILPRM